MSHRISFTPILFMLLLPLASQARAPDISVSTNLPKQLIGTWCLNQEKFMDDVSYSGEIWEFSEQGKYTFNTLSEDRYSIDGDTVKMENFGSLKVLQINDKEMVGKVYSTYYFSKDRCADSTLKALDTTRLNNAIIKGDIEQVKTLISKGVDISQADTRSSLQSTPLMVAVAQQNEAIIELILQQNPDLSITNSMGKTALDIANKSSSITIKNRIKDAH